MNIKKAALSCLCLLLCAALLGCSDAPAGTDTYESAVLAVVPVSDNGFPDPSFGRNEEKTAAASAGANNFAFRLSALLAEQAGEGNLVCSPFSVWISLAALVGSTDNQYKGTLLESLGMPGLSDTDVNLAAIRMRYSLTKQREKQMSVETDIPFHEPITMANAVFVGRDVSLKHDFAQTYFDSFSGRAMQVEFSSQEAVDAANQWCNENTGGLIPEMVQRFDPNTVVALANAITFSDRWSWEFDPNETAEGVFHAPGGDTRAFYMPRTSTSEVYYEDEQLQAISLSFKAGDSLTILLPRDGDAAGLLSSMTGERFEEIRAGSDYATGTLRLPRFSINSGNLKLENMLASMGVPLLNSATAPLTRLLKGNQPAYVSGVTHKAVIEVDEKGTTAAAVTVVQAPGSAMPEPTDPFEMTCDRPFVFVLYSNTADGGCQVLFTGMVNQP